MSRQDSMGAHSVGTDHSSGSYYNHVHAGSMYHTLSQASYPLSPGGSEGSPRSDTLDYTPTPQTGNFLNNYSFNGDTVTYGGKNTSSSMQSHILAEVPIMDNYMNEDALYATFVHDPEIIANGSPAMFDNSYATFVQPMLDDTWLPAPQMRSPAASSSSDEPHSPLAYLPDGSQVPNSVARPTKKTAPRQSKVISDFARNTQQYGAPETSEDFVKYTSGRSMDSENHARDHELYHNAAPFADGLYHCPWEGQDCCQHRPEKLKCNYDKFVDSHLKPYRCKIIQCGELRFSSTACLLRHEREAHAMHGHGEKPYLCEYENCERASPGNGFPRHWNLRDHMRRVHNDPGAAKSSTSGGSPPQAIVATTPSRTKKRKHDKPASVSQDKNEKVTKSKSKRDSKESSSVEHHKESYRRLLASVHKLEDPRVTNYEQCYTAVYDNLDSLRESSNINNNYYYLQE